ncbi:MAG TPA: hypothetical protein VHB68_20235 [Steroidobacteraceae bacterium]|nr:hypothetical protein [Steroidobacteraceae bacterium]
MTAGTLLLFDVLVERAHLEPRDAAVVAEAIYDCTRAADLVTKSFLEERLASLKAEMRAEMKADLAILKSEILHHLYFALLGQFGVLTAMMYFFTSHLK